MACLNPADIHQLDSKRHKRAVESLADDLQLPIEEVASKYEEIRISISHSAKIKDFIPVLIVKKIRRQYKSF
jgi:hypothetical protein